MHLKNQALANIALLMLACLHSSGVRAQTILNASYDPTRELYAEINPAFARAWQDQTRQPVTIRNSHTGSGAQARAVIDGLDADLVTLAIPSDIDAIVQHGGRVAQGWEAKLPNRAVPFTSTVLFVVRRGNPKGIHDWPDLVRPGVSVITPNPKTSGGARWNYLAAWGWARQTLGGDEKARAYVEELFRHVPVLDTGARGSTMTFAQRGQGDVLLAWEDDANLAVRQRGPSKLEIVIPSMTIEADPPVAVVDEVVDRRGTRRLAEAYLRFLFAPEAQEIAARHWLRPTDPAVMARHAGSFPAVPTFTAAQFGSWDVIQHTHFDEGGIFDQIYRP